MKRPVFEPAVLKPRVIPAYVAWMYGGRIPFPLPTMVRVR